MIGIDGRYIQDHFPGIGRYTFNLIDALARVAPNERLLVLHNPALPNSHYDVAALGRYPNVQLSRVTVPTFSPAEQIGLLPRAPKVDLFHSPYYYKPYFSRVPSVVTIFDLLPLFYPAALPNARTRFIFRVAMGLAARTATRIIAPSSSTCRDLVARLRVARDKIDVIPLAADARFRPQPAAEIARVRAVYGLEAEYVLSVGINKPHKNFRTLIEAWERAGDRQRILAIAGAWDARYADLATQAELAKARTGADIRFIRNVADGDLPALYGGALVFVLPSLYEGFGLPPLEAMACGVPVVVSNVSSLPEVVADAGVLVDPHDADGLAARLRELLDDPGRRANASERSLRRASEFSWERTARETLAVYEMVR